MKLRISEIFQSIQGEGINAGKPVVFLRTAICNLACSWCDTKYTWDWENYDYQKEVRELDVFEIKNQILQYGRKHLVITGGEPLLQQEGLEQLLEEMNPLDYFVEVETNCTVKPSPKIIKYVNQWNISPKLSNSNNKLELYENEECYNLFSKLDNSYFKYVIEEKKDLQEVEYFIQKYTLPRKKVLLMTQAENKEDLFLREPLVKELSESTNLLYSPRLHLERWNNQRGK